MSTIYVRISLLTVATCLFGLVWSNDHKPIRKQTASVTYDFEWPCEVETLEPVDQTVAWQQVDEVLVPLSASREITQVKAESSKGQGLNLVNVKDLAFPLPKTLTTGSYRVINQRGELYDLDVSQTDLKSWGIQTDQTARNSYEIQDNENRWHFIRIEPVIVADKLPQPTQQEMQQAWGKVLGFAGKTLSSATSPVKSWLNPQRELRVSSDAAELN